MTEISQEKNDRGAGILLATNVENSLDYVLLKTLYGPTDKLFDQNGPLSSFSNKIQMGRALGLYGEQTSSNLDTIRHIRNAFAHAQIPITFETPEVAAGCRLLTIQEVLFPRAVREPPVADKMTARALFTEVCNTIAHNFQWLHRREALRAAAEAAKSAHTPNGIQILFRPAPLP